MLHQAQHHPVGLGGASAQPTDFTQPVQVAGVIVCAKKAGLVVAPAQHDVERDTI